MIVNYFNQSQNKLNPLAYKNTNRQVYFKGKNEEKLSPVETETDKFSKATQNDANEKMDQLSKAALANDKQKLESIIGQIVSSSNKITDKLLFDTLFDKKNKPELLRSMAAGIFFQKGNYEPLIKYAEDAVKNDGKLDNNIQNDEPLIIATYGLMKGISSNDKNLETRCLSALIKLFKASCDENAKTPLADQLMQSFMINLPKKGDVAYGMLSGVFNDKTAGVGARSMALYIMNNANPVSTLPLLKDFVTNPDKFADKASDKLYLMDVATNSLSHTVREFPDINYSDVNKSLNKLNIDELRIKAGLEKQDEGHVAVLSDVVSRIKGRITALNALTNKEQQKAA